MNGTVGSLVHRDGVLSGAVDLATADGLVSAIRMQLNPTKPAPGAGR